MAIGISGRTARVPSSRSGRLICRAVRFALLALLLFAPLAGGAMAQSSVRPPEGAVENAVPQGNPNVRLPGSGNAVTIPPAVDPTASKGSIYDSDTWRKVRRGVQGTVSIPDKKAGQLIQSNGELWRNLRNGPLATYSVWAMGGMLVLLALFFLIRGRVRVEEGLAGRTITRFTSLERMSHWLLAVSFVVLALTGLNMLYGRYVFEPVIGKAGFAMLTGYGKEVHDHVAFAFMVGLALAFVNWVGQNFPNRHDVIWLVKGGGILWRSHPPARKFNAGQKILFWLVILGGVSISLSGISMLFPFQTAMFSKTFALLNVFGLGLPTDLTAVEEMQYATTWHAIVAIFLIVVIFGHIYIGTIGMVGAFDAMGTGEVDVNWAKEHHNLWAEEALADKATADGGEGPKPMPAE